MKNYSEAQWESWFDSLAVNDFLVIDDFLESELLNLVRKEFIELEHKNRFNYAAVGNNENEQIIHEIRSDLIHWVEKDDGIIQSKLHELFDEFRLLLNRYCYLSLSDFEFHFAKYPVGSFYKKHLDQFNNRSNRLISVVLYLNDNWKDGDGGELKVYPNNSKKPELIAPISNRLVVFKSDCLPHEVLVSKFERRSVTGWMLHQPAKIVLV